MTAAYEFPGPQLLNAIKLERAWASVSLVGSEFSYTNGLQAVERRFYFDYLRSRPCC